MTEFIEYIFFLLLYRCARLLSFRGAGAVGSFLGSSVFHLTKLRKGVTFENLRNAFPDLPPERLRSIALGAYRNYGRSIVEMLWAASAPEHELRATVRLRNPGVVQDALKRGKGLILLSGHFGSWELLVSGLRLQIGVPFTMIVQHQRNGRIDALIDSTRRRFGNVTVPMGPSVREVVRALREQRVVAILGDQSGPKEAVFVEFFGRPAATHRGAAAFSLKIGSPIVMTFLIRQTDGIVEAVFEELDMSGLPDSSEESILEVTRRHTAVLERYVRLYPDHWLWMHKRWKHTGFYESHKDHERHSRSAFGEGAR